MPWNFSSWHKVGNYIIYNYLWKWKSLSRVQLSATPWTVACQAPLSMDSPGQNTGVGCHSLLQGIFPIQGSNPGLPHCRQILYHLSHQGSPRILGWVYAAAAAKLLQLCLTLCDPIDSSPAGSPVPGILQARTLEWAAISFSSAWKWKVKMKLLSRIWLLATPSTAAYQAPPSMGFSRQEYWSGVPFPSPGVGIYNNLNYI